MLKWRHKSREKSTDNSGAKQINLKKKIKKGLNLYQSCTQAGKKHWKIKTINTRKTKHRPLKWYTQKDRSGK